jgi:hypothetical protein
MVRVVAGEEREILVAELYVREAAKDSLAVPRTKTNKINNVKRATSLQYQSNRSFIVLCFIGNYLIC